MSSIILSKLNSVCNDRPSNTHTHTTQHNRSSRRQMAANTESSTETAIKSMTSTRVGGQTTTQTIRLRWPGNVVSVRSVDSGRQTRVLSPKKTETDDSELGSGRGTLAGWLLCSCRLISASITRTMSTTFNKLTAASGQPGFRQSKLDRRLTGQITALGHTRHRQL